MPLALHPWNVGFRWTDTEPTHGALTAEQVRAFDADGFVVVRDVFTPDEVAAVRTVIDRFESETQAALRQLDDDRLFIAEAGAITFAPHLVTRAPELAAFARHPAFAAIVADLVGPDVDLYWDQAVYKDPEKPRRFPWHQDNGYAFVEPQQYLTCWVPLTDAHLANGCPQVAPGLHRGGTLAHRYVEPLGYECFTAPPVEVAVAEAAVGDVVVFSSLTPHLTGPNLTDEVRKAYILQYAPVGAEVLEGDPQAGAPTARRRCEEPRHLAVARDGRPVAT
ncbi:phytanoyl-CoA dioxygenase family protein [Iamia sp. SCSIO 61187]|uniref:phytanoyl-CoA dioxygenase family protein n=1 Tax=Iamia sp. SCSIO 61187 TaxID=2722752 RepID=UPI001C627025|nr:phytanoyl-CoA dioxygenase family protein [Iamia sp. SCSIO 61187]QYG92114.1 phytanoyl-CoA dioxygenase family protein [Iamia sp. SCSIO 61187]